jgi:DNA topoisomerase-1
MKLIIVESPTKAKTISRFLNRGFAVASSYGHIRDLPKSKMGVDIENDFKPHYVIPKDKSQRVKELKEKSRQAEAVILATDEDREGEAIAWHLTKILNLGGNFYQRIVFHEITKDAVLKALKNPRGIDMNLVDAQQARRILDRLVGYELSPFLWKKVARGLSAGRVQSVAVRLIVEREEEIKNFKSEEYWKITALLSKKSSDKKSEHFEAKLVKKDDKKIPKLGIKTKKEADKITKDLKGAEYQIVDIEKKEIKKNPLPPFTTSTLQQEANRRFGYSAKQTMMLAQQLYEGIELGEKGSTGLITYMRTDSFNLADQALKNIKEVIEKEFGKNYSQQKKYRTKSSSAQEAHEAIRPTDSFRRPEDIKNYLDGRQYKIYELIWKRTLASQMKPAVFDNIIVDIKAKNYLFEADGSTIKFDGFLKIWPAKIQEFILPPLEKDEILNLIKLTPSQHFTQPPSRFTEAGLVKVLEENGIGRPSTYAPIISTIQERGYVGKDENKKLYPTEIGVLVNGLLVKHFSKIVDVGFTADLEKDLDKIAEEGREWVPVIRRFYEPFKENLEKKEKQLSKKEITEEKTDEVCEKCGKPMVIKLGRYGKFSACSGYPECRNTRPIGEEKKLNEKYNSEKCELCGAPMVLKRGRFGLFLGCSNYPECKNIKKIEKKLGMKCPECKKGEIVEKKTKKGKIFYGCNRYPDCDFALWEKPTGDLCPKCQAPMVFANKNKIRCSNKECGYEES